MIGIKQNRIWLATAATVGIGIGAAGPLAIGADPTQPPAAVTNDQETQNWTVPAGFKEVNLDAQSGIRSGLVKLTERAVTKGDFNRLLAELSTQDKERAREYKGADQDKLNSIIDQIQQAWKNKYGQDFSISDKNLVFDQRFAMAEFEVTDPAVAISNWPLPAVAGQAVTAGSHSDAGNDKDQAKDAKLTKGRHVALVRFPASNGISELTVSMIHELPVFWRVDIPNDRTGEQIYNDLSNQLMAIRDHQDRWPDHVDDAYRLVARHVLAAVYGVQLGTHQG